jgi:hypothetical protein
LLHFLDPACGSGDLLASSAPVRGGTQAAIIAQEITDDLEAALEQFATISEDLKK